MPNTSGKKPHAVSQEVSSKSATKQVLEKRLICHQTHLWHYKESRGKSVCSEEVRGGGYAEEDGKRRPDEVGGNVPLFLKG